MILHVKSAVDVNANEKIYPLFNDEGFDKLVSEFPQLKESMLKYSDLRLIAKDMAGYLNSHHIHAWVTES